jgi:hypothetical protein
MTVENGQPAYLSQGVSVPEAHIDGGVVVYDQRHASSHAILADLFSVKVQDEKPLEASLAIPYRGFWYDFVDNDISSKRTIGVLNSLVRLKIQTAGAQTTPVLMLPVGR